MSYLYIDTSFEVSIGILNEKFYWDSFVSVKDKKSSALLHTLIHENLEQNGIKVKELEGIFTIAGPGSYTGVRLAEGMAQVFEWQEIPTYSFYHFDVPLLSGQAPEGIFISKAFKGEFFCYKWSGSQNEKSLRPMSELESYLNQNTGPFYTHFFEELKVDKKMNLTSKLIIDHPSQIFEKVKKAETRVGPSIYRPLEKEFKKQ